jgi:ankyrin repeat protein
MPAMPIFMRCSLLLVLLLAACQSEMTPLHRAAMSGDAETVRSYVKDRRNLDPRWDQPSRGLEGNYANLVDVTPLMLAARNGQLETVKLLVEGGADLYAQANTQLRGDPLTAFDFSVQGGHVPVADYLWKRSDGRRLDGRLMSHISNACVFNCKEGAGSDATTNIALYLISIASDEVAGGGVGSAVCASPKAFEMLQFVEKHAARPPRNTLHCIAYGTYSRHRPFEERKAILAWMLDHGAPINGRLYGSTPLAGAAAAHDLDTARLLVERGADPNLAGSSGIPPIAAAANTCVHAPSADYVDDRMRAQLAVVQYLAPLSDRTLYTSQDVLKKGYLIGQCCARQPQTPTQRRVCEVFGL